MVDLVKEDLELLSDKRQHLSLNDKSSA